MGGSVGGRSEGTGAEAAGRGAGGQGEGARAGEVPRGDGWGVAALTLLIALFSMAVAATVHSILATFGGG